MCWFMIKLKTDSNEKKKKKKIYLNNYKFRFVILYSKEKKSLKKIHSKYKFTVIVPTQALQLLIRHERVRGGGGRAVPEDDQAAVVSDQNTTRDFGVFADCLYRARVHFEVFWTAE